jgi:hypothetical protein
MTTMIVEMAAIVGSIKELSPNLGDGLRVQAAV